MRTVLFWALIVTHCSVYSQSDSAINYTEVITVPNTSKEDLFIRARQWFNEAFVNSKSVLQINDKESGELAGKGYMVAYYKFKILGREGDYPVDVNFICNVWIKENRYKYEIGSFDASTPYDQGNRSFGLLTSAKACPRNFPMVKQKAADKMWTDIKGSVDMKVLAMIASLKTAMNGTQRKDDF